MSRTIFVNLPVADLDRATTFYKQLGFATDPNFSGQFATCIVISDTICVMLLVARFFATFTTRPVADANEHTGSIHALSAESRTAVDDFLERALAAGALEARAPDDLPLMYSRSFFDLDGHLWELLYMDTSSHE